MFHFNDEDKVRWGVAEIKKLLGDKNKLVLAVDGH